MKISLRLFLGYFLIVALAGWFVLNIFMQEVKPGVRHATEGTLVDTAQVLAGIAAQDMADGNIAGGRLAQAFSGLNQVPVGAEISGMLKDRVEYRVYVVDRQGLVIYDSEQRDVGKDFSRWNDVYLTLRGQYGARSSPEAGSESGGQAVMYVAAPIRRDGEIIGALTVAKPGAALEPVIRRSEQKIFWAGILLLGVALLIGGLMVWWINRAIGKLVSYAKSVAEGHSAALPRQTSPELAILGDALENMRIKLDGKAYVEEYVHALTHELKSPLAAVQGAGELLAEDLPSSDRQRFSGNIREQSVRMQRLVERLLSLAQVESRQALSLEPVSLGSVVSEVLQEKSLQSGQRQIAWRVDVPDALIVAGDRLLLAQAISNLIDNAMEFSPSGGTVEVSGRLQDGQCCLSVRDHGPGIPDYARDRIFERFYSLPRPEQGKSTGLGLSFVREVMHLHGGMVEVGNHPDGGVLAVLRLAARN